MNRHMPDESALIRYRMDIYYMYMYEGYIRSRLSFDMITQLWVANMLNALRNEQKAVVLQRHFQMNLLARNCVSVDSFD